MKLVYAANTRTSWKRSLERPGLRIVWSNEEKILQTEGLCYVIRRGAKAGPQLQVYRLHPFDLFITLLNVSIVFHADKNNPVVRSAAGSPGRAGFNAVWSAKFSSHTPMDPLFIGRKT